MFILKHGLKRLKTHRNFKVMPKYKPSLGKITIATPHKEFSAYIRQELLNTCEWNPGWITTDGRTRFACKQWTITVLATKIIVESKEPVVYLRRGFKILMGSGKLELS